MAKNTKTEQAREMREQKATERKQIAEPIEYTETTNKEGKVQHIELKVAGKEMGGAVEAEKTSSIPTEEQKAARNALAMKQINTSSYEAVLRGKMSLGDAKAAGRKEPAKQKPRRGELPGVEYGTVKVTQGEEVFVKAVVWHNGDNACGTFFGTGGEPLHGTNRWCKLDEVAFVKAANLDSVEVEKVVEKEIEKPVPAPIPEDSKLRKEIERMYAESWEKAQDYKRPSKTEMVFQSRMKKLAESLGLGIDFNKLDTDGQLMDSKAS